MALEDLHLIERQISQLDQEMADLLRSSQDQVQRLAEVPGLGPKSQAKYSKMEVSLWESQRGGKWQWQGEVLKRRITKSMSSPGGYTVMTAITTLVLWTTSAVISFLSAWFVQFTSEDPQNPRRPRHDGGHAHRPNCALSERSSGNPH